MDGNLATTADNLVYTTTTDANGQYHFGVLPLGTYQIQAPTGTLSYPQPVGTLAIRIDSDAATPLGTVGITLANGGTASANAGYVEQNDAPVNHLPATAPSGLEDTTFGVAGVTISDVDAGNGTLQVTLSVLHGTLSLSGLPSGVTQTGANTAALTLTGNLTGLNAALANLRYLGQANYNGADTLTINTNDRGNFGDHDGNGIPGQLSDALIAVDTLPITVIAVNDAPVAVNDTASATEAGGTLNSQVGVDPTGNVLSNDTDVDIATNGDALRVVSVTNQNGATLSLPNIGATSIAGLFGTLTLGAAGGYQYTVDNNNPAVEALRLSGQTLSEHFTYLVFDTFNARSTGTLTVTIHGANDTPVGVNDTGSATEAGGVLNGTAGSDATGNVLTNDTDVDSVANGETKQVTGITNQLEGVVNSPLVTVTAGTTSGTGTSIAGTFGTLKIGADGTYRYVVDNNNAAVQQLVPADAPLVDIFSYRVTDAGGLSDLAELQIQVRGANDNPVASDDQATAIAGAAALGVNPLNPSGNVITVASRPGTLTQPGGNGIDTDVDHTDQPNTLLKVNGVRTGPGERGRRPRRRRGRHDLGQRHCARGKLRHAPHRRGRHLYLRCRQQQRGGARTRTGRDADRNLHVPDRRYERPDGPGATRHHGRRRERSASRAERHRACRRGRRRAQCDARRRSDGQCSGQRLRSRSRCDFRHCGPHRRRSRHRHGGHAGPVASGAVRHADAQRERQLRVRREQRECRRAGVAAAHRPARRTLHLHDRG